MAHSSMTHTGTGAFMGNSPAPIIAKVMIPIDFCASFVPWKNAMNAADTICSLENHLFTNCGEARLSAR